MYYVRGERRGGITTTLQTHGAVQDMSGEAPQGKSRFSLLYLPCSNCRDLLPNYRWVLVFIILFIHHFQIIFHLVSRIIFIFPIVVFVFDFYNFTLSISINFSFLYIFFLALILNISIWFRYMKYSL